MSVLLALLMVAGSGAAPFGQAAITDTELSATRAPPTPVGVGPFNLPSRPVSDTMREIYDNWEIDVAVPLIAEATARAAQAPGTGSLPFDLRVGPGIDLRAATTASNTCCTR